MSFSFFQGWQIWRCPWWCRQTI